MKKQELFYIQFKETIQFNNALWFGKHNSGYVDNLDYAKKFTLDQAERICRTGEFSAWSVKYVEEHIRKTIDISHLDNSFIKATKPQKQKRKYRLKKKKNNK